MPLSFDEHGPLLASCRLVKPQTIRYSSEIIWISGRFEFAAL